MGRLACTSSKTEILNKIGVLEGNGHLFRPYLVDTIKLMALLISRPTDNVTIFYQQTPVFAIEI